MQWSKAVDRTNSETFPQSTSIGKLDPVERLPADARRILEELRDQRDDLRATLDALQTKLADAFAAKADAERELKTLIDPVIAVGYGDGHVHGDGAPEVVQAKAKVEAATAAVEPLREKCDARTLRVQELGRLVENVERWLAGLPAGVTIAAHTDAVKPAKSATVDSARRQIAELKADLHAVRSAPITSTAARALAKAEIQRLAERGRPDVYALIEHAGDIVWPTVSIRAPLWGHVTVAGAQPQLAGWATVTGVDALSLVAWLFKDDLTAALEAEVAEAADDRHALSDEARGARTAELEAAILAAERIEVALVSQAAGDVPHRPAADPRAILGLSSELPGPAGQ